MPNWCENELKITGKGVKDIAAILNDKKTELLFESLCPIEGYSNENWDYNVYTNAYGTEWDVRLQDMNHMGIDEEEIELIFDTAWSPPGMFCAQLALKYNVKVQLTYYEGGMAFGGRASFEPNKDGELIYEEAQHSYMQAKYLYDEDSFWLDMGHHIDVIEEGETLESATAKNLLMFSYLNKEDQLYMIKMLEKHFTDITP